MSRGWNVRVTGGDFTGLGDELLAELRPKAEAAVEAGGDILVDAVKAELRRRSGGPAPEGEPPAYDDGDLHNSIERIPTKWRGMLVQSGAQSDLEQAGRLEFGGTDVTGRRVLPHPYFGPAGERARGDIERAMKEKLR